MHLFLLIFSLFIISCGKNGLSSFVGEIYSSNSAEAEDDISTIEVEEGDSAPVMIMGASLACHPTIKNQTQGFVEISCYLEKDGAVLGDINILASDISILDDNGESLFIDFLNQEDGSFIIKVVLKESTNINISIKNIQGSETEFSDLDSLATVISSEDVSKVSEQTQEENTEQPDNSQKEVETDWETDMSEVVTTGASSEPKTIDCSSIGTPGTWILVPGDPDYGTSDFCVMKYEAKCEQANGQLCSDPGIEEIPNSTAANTPWVNISQEDAKAECASLGEGFHLITNEEWMTIGANVANIGFNWDGGVIGTNRIASGHSDSDPSMACAANADDVNAYVESDCTGAAGGDDFSNRRTHQLSNGEVIWDLAGNVWELTSLFNKDDKPTPVGTNWSELFSVTGTSSLSLTKLIPTNGLKPFWDDTWDAGESIGQYYPGEAGTGGALLRGGVLDNNQSTGIFAASLHLEPYEINALVGFRCTYTLP